MKARTILLGFMLLSLFCADGLPTRAQTAKPATTARPQTGAITLSPQARLKQYVANLQKTPGDRALREKIIKLALTMKPAPALPQEAQDELAKGNGLATPAAGQQALLDALAHFDRAALLAPWWPDAYSSLGSVQEKLERFDDARASLSLYLLAAPMRPMPTRCGRRSLRSTLRSGCGRLWPRSRAIPTTQRRARG